MNTAQPLCGYIRIGGGAVAPFVTAQQVVLYRGVRFDLMTPRAVSHDRPDSHPTPAIGRRVVDLVADGAVRRRG